MYQRSRMRKEELCEDAEALERTKSYLSGYQLAVEMLSLLEDERSADSGHMGAYSASLRGEQRAYWERRARDICRLIDAIVPPMEKMLLHYHYILGYTVEATAELLDISRRSAFRMKKRGIALAAARMQQGNWSMSAPPPIPA